MYYQQPAAFKIKSYLYAIIRSAGIDLRFVVDFHKYPSSVCLIRLALADASSPRAPQCLQNAGVQLCLQDLLHDYSQAAAAAALLNLLQNRIKGLGPSATVTLR